MLDYPPAVRQMIAALRQLPTIGPRSAERLALHILKSDPALADSLARSIETGRQAIRPCTRCGFYAQQPLCEVCLDSARNSALLCIVEQASDVLAFEKSGAFQGLYHVLGGCLSPLDEIGPEELQIPRLLQRLREGGITEVILGLNAEVKGETTTLYLAREIHALGLKVSRLATGISVGGSLEFADSATLGHALKDRKVV